MVDMAKADEVAIGVWYMPSASIQRDDWPTDFSVELSNGSFWVQELEGGKHRISVKPTKPGTHTECKYFVENDAFYGRYGDVAYSIGENTFRAKWMFDGCKKMEEVISRLEGNLKLYKRMREEGWEVAQTVKDDHGTMKIAVKKADLSSLEDATVVRVDSA